MKYNSTRDKSCRVSAAYAIAHGLAPDGGLFVPEELPPLSLQQIEALCKTDYRGRAEEILALFLDEFSREEIRAIVTAAYGDNYDDFTIAPLRRIDDKTAVLELWHGPTCAFKDMALQILPHLLTASLKKCGETRKVCILVATSGDTGKAALEGFADVEDTKILVFYPHNGVSDVQRLQMVTQRGGNVSVAAVRGNFDDAQSGVKTLFGDAELSDELSDKGWFLSSANSINWGRLLPQIVYYFSAYCELVNSKYVRIGDDVDFAVPTGNFGDILACWYAKKMGLPIGKLICASNENNVLADFFKTGIYDRNRAFHTTISPSMDILVSSNLERLLYSVCGDDMLVAEYMRSLNEKGSYTVGSDIFKVLSDNFVGGFCSDADTKKTIASVYNKHNYLIDTHTAVAYKLMNEYRNTYASKRPTVVVSTASPFKFCDSVLNALGENIDAKGTELIKKLSERTGVKAPMPLSDLDKREKRFELVINKHEMRQTVTDFLK